MNKHSKNLRDGVSGPHKRGAKYVVSHEASPENILAAADEIDRIEAENTELRHALTAACAVIAEIVDRVQPLMPLILAESERIKR